jgi:hypothetical protein
MFNLSISAWFGLAALALSAPAELDVDRIIHQAPTAFQDHRATELELDLLRKYCIHSRRMGILSELWLPLLSHYIF